MFTMATLAVTPSGQSNDLRKVRTCAHCGSEEIYRQRPRGLMERHVFKVFHFAPFWCAGCDRHFYLRMRKAAARPVS
jgi:hypothetical protein